MAKVSFAEVKPIEEYEKSRDELRRRVIAARNRRRVEVGDRVSLAFENHETVLFQIQEMMRAEKLSSPEQIAFEVETYNALLGDQTTLAATLFIEIVEREKIREELDRFQGLDRDRRLYLQIGDGPRIPAEFEPGHSTGDRIAAVHYVRFPLTAEAKKDFLRLELPARVVIDHPSYQARTELAESTRLALAEDLMSG